MVAGAATFNGVNQTTPLGTFASSIGTGTSASVSLSSATGEIVFDTVTAESVGSMTAGAGQTAHWNTFAGSSGAIGFGGASTEAGATSVNMSWSLGSSNIWAIGAVPIRPSVLPTASSTPTLIPTATATPTLTPTVIPPSVTSTPPPATPTPGSVAIILDNSSSTTGQGNTVSSLTVSHTTAGSDKLLLVGVSIDISNTLGRSVNTVTYNGSPLTN